MTVVPPLARPETNSQSRIRWPGSSPALGSSSSSTGGLGEQADGDVDPLLVAAGEGRDLVVAALGEPGLLEHRSTVASDVLAPSSLANSRRFSATVSRR